MSQPVCGRVCVCGRETVHTTHTTHTRDDNVLTLLERILILEPLQLHCTEVILDDSVLSPSTCRLQCSLGSLQSTITSNQCCGK